MSGLIKMIFGLTRIPSARHQNKRENFSHIVIDDKYGIHALCIALRLKSDSNRYFLLF